MQQVGQRELGRAKVLAEKRKERKKSSGRKVDKIAIVRSRV